MFFFYTGALLYSVTSGQYIAYSILETAVGYHNGFCAKCKGASNVNSSHEKSLGYL